MLKSIPEVNQMIAEGKALLLAGSEEALSQLSKGNWIGGTIPYFMDEDGLSAASPGCLSPSYPSAPALRECASIRWKRCRRFARTLRKTESPT